MSDCEIQQLNSGHDDADRRKCLGFLCKLPTSFSPPKYCLTKLSHSKEAVSVQASLLNRKNIAQTTLQKRNGDHSLGVPHSGYSVFIGFLVIPVRQYMAIKGYHWLFSF